MFVHLVNFNNDQIHLFPKICQRHSHALSAQMAVSSLKRLKHDSKLGVTYFLHNPSFGIPKKVATFIKLDSFPSSNEGVLRFLFRFAQQKELLSDAENVIRTS